MSIEWLPQTAAILAAGIAALTDALRGKVYNRVTVAALAVALAWLGLYGVWSAFGGETDFTRFPELGRFMTNEEVVRERKALVAREVRLARAVSGLPDETQGPMPWEETANTSVWPPPATQHGNVDQQSGISFSDGGTEAGDEAYLDQLDPPSYWIYLAKIALNTVLAFLIGFGLWWFGMWAAGDAKLFAVLAALLPLSTYSGAYWPWFPGYVLLFNTFLGVMAILVLELVFRLARLVLRPSPEEAESWRSAWAWIRGHVKDMVFGFIAIFFGFVVIKTLRMLTRDLMAMAWDVSDSVLVFFLLFLMFQPLSRAMRRWYVGVPITVVTLAWVVWVSVFPTDEYDFVRVISISGKMLLLILSWMVYQLYLNVFDFKAIRIWELRPRMLLAPRTLEILKEDLDLLDHKMGPIGPDGLAAEQTDTLRRWWIDRGKGPRLWISRTFPFAPALFVGTVFTVFFGGYLLKF